MLKLKKNFIPHWVFLVFFAGLWLSGCGGDTSSGSVYDPSSTDGSTASFYGGTVVDPYITGAVLAEVSPHGTTLQYSTPSDEKGKFYFPSPLTSGSIIQMKGDARGKHLMRPFEGILKRVVDQEGPLVVSPLTTLLANGMSAGEVLTLLAESGLNGLTAEDLLKDPLAELIQCDWPLSVADLTLLQANVGANAFFARLGNYDLAAENILAQKDQFRKSVELARSITLELSTLNNLERELWREADSVGLPLRPEPILWAGVSIAEASIAAERQGEDLLLNAGEKMVYARDLALLYFVQQNRGEPKVETAIADGWLPQIAANSVVVIPVDIRDEVSWSTEDAGEGDIVPPAPSEPTETTESVTVFLTSPASGTTYTSAQTVTVAATAADNVGVSKVELYDGSTLLKNDTTSPYYFDWPITSADNGSHSLTAKVYDAAGNSTVSAAVVINVKIETIVSTETVFYGYDKNAGANDDPYAAPYGGITRYVDPGKGVNSGNGSITSPWKDLQYALTHATAGDSIYLRGGVHNYGITINGNVAATQLKPVEVLSYPGEWAIIDGSNIANGNLVRLFNESWIIFRNFEIRYSDKTRVSNGIYAENLTDCEFHNIYMHNNNGAGFSAKELYRVKFFNCSAINNVDIQTSGDSADGFSVTSGDSNKFYRCVATGNSDDGYDFWAASKHYLEDCVSATNGSGTGGDGNGFKLGKPDPAPYEGLRGGYHTLVRCISLKNKFRGYSENATTNGSTLTGCIAYNSGQNWELPNAAHKVTNGISFDGNGDKIGSATTVTASEGQGFGGTVYVSDFESVNIADMNNQTAGQRFFYAVRNLF